MTFGFWYMLARYMYMLITKSKKKMWIKMNTCVYDTKNATFSNIHIFLISIAAKVETCLIGLISPRWSFWDQTWLCLVQRQKKINKSTGTYYRKFFSPDLIKHSQVGSQNDRLLETKSMNYVSILAGIVLRKLWRFEVLPIVTLF